MKEAKTKSLRSIINYGPEVTLVPFSGIQILDFGFSLSDKKISYDYAEIIETSESVARGQFNRESNYKSGLSYNNVRLLPIDEDSDENYDNKQNSPNHSVEKIEYSVRSRDSLKPFINNWVPVPVLRIRKDRESDGSERFDPGPTTWARMRVVNLDPQGKKLGDEYRIQLAIDTSLVENNSKQTYLAPEIEDSANSREFRFVFDPSLMSWFLTQPVQSSTNVSDKIDHQSWIMDWLNDLMQKFFNLKENKEIEEDANLEGCARYLSYLRLVGEMVELPKIKFVDTVSELDRVSFVDVDLVLDVGNSRTCGILIEKFPNDPIVDFTQCYPLAIRDLSKPEFYYHGLISSRVEFSGISFGNDRCARASGRNNAFLWPSMLRVGAEASRLTDEEVGTGNISGISSPKRYIWDDKPSNQNWRFHNHNDSNPSPRVALAMMQFLNESGDCIKQVEEEEKQKLRKRDETSKNVAFRPRFSRSSLYCFIIAEIISHVLVQINDPAVRSRRAQSGLPRRLNKIIITIPTATPLQEQAIIKSRAESALKLIWNIMLQTGHELQKIKPPEVSVEWDEASCTQLVYLFNEVTQKFTGQIDSYFNLMGKPRKSQVKESETTEQSFRICSIDIGAGTTDMMVTTYTCEDNRLIHPKQNFREGFRIAGDDIIQEIISRIILRSLADDIGKRSNNSIQESEITTQLSKLFRVISDDQIDRQAQRQFILKVFVPLAIELIQKCENIDSESEIKLSIKETFQDSDNGTFSQGNNGETVDTNQISISQKLLEYIEQPVRDLGVSNWNLCDWELEIPYKDIDMVVQEVMKSALENMIEVIDHLDCDVVLLSGRASKLPTLRALIENSCAVRPDRIISMHKYGVGLWYPFRQVSEVIGDPKTTVVVGGLLMMLAENRIENFIISTNSIRMESTAKYIGELERDGKIMNDKILFVENKEPEDDVFIKMHGGPVHIGSRQLPFERWTTVPLYKLDFVDPDSMKHRKPVKVFLKLRSFEEDLDPEDPEEVLKLEALKEHIEIENAEDNEERNVRHKTELSLRIHTLGINKSLIDDYWLDAGIIA